MNTTDLRHRVARALEASDDFEQVEPLEDEDDVLGVELDGELFFVKVIPA